MDSHFIAAVIYKYLQGGSLSAGEQLALDQWIEKEKINRDVFEQLQDGSGLRAYLEERMDQARVEQAFDIFKDITSAGNMSVVSAGSRAPVIAAATAITPVIAESRVHNISRRRWAAAAAIFLLAAAGYLLFQYNHNDRQIARNAARRTPADIAPGRQGAILTLANGRQMVLDSLGNGLVATQNGANLILADGRLTYTKDRVTTDEITFNTITTPKGRQFQLLLPDGTKVWLNAASTLTYPTAFTGQERKVSVTGEAYFEVAKNARMPFKVSINDRNEIDVLGTNFDINAYTDDTSLNTTLLEGIVQVTSSRDKILLNPGQQASVSRNDPAAGSHPSGSTHSSSGINVRTADIEKVMAWKNDLFDFEGATLAEVMKQISRWYDIEVVYQKGIPTFEFGGKIRRDLTLANLLKFLEGAGVHFRIEEGRRLIVLP